MKDTSLFRVILDNISDGVCFVDKNLRISLWNQAAGQITGFATQDVLGQRCEAPLMAHAEPSGKPIGAAAQPLYLTLGDGKVRGGEVLLRRKDNGYAPVEIQVLPIYSNGRVAGAVEIFKQNGATLSPEKAPKPDPAKEKDRFIGTPIFAETADKLTGLPSRGAVQNRLLQLFEQGGPRTGAYCLVLANLDNFAAYNATYGKEVGDMALQSVGDSFLNSYEDEDFIGRWGKDEFLGIFRLQGGADITAAAEKVRALVAESGVDYPDFFASLTASVGAVPLGPGATPEGAVAQAEELMHQSKQAGKNRSTIAGA